MSSFFLNYQRNVDRVRNKNFKVWDQKKVNCNQNSFIIPSHLYRLRKLDFYYHLKILHLGYNPISVVQLYSNVPVLNSVKTLCQGFGLRIRWLYLLCSNLFCSFSSFHVFFLLFTQIERVLVKWCSCILKSPI